ncbi:winged helix-turn-helix domain-containing protein [Serratia marcescens]|nr:winged helix-turn-helix domain-containing protein [Serratia marcescens]MBH2865970.1 winged helix-turn-helix domain-containing protein [Serratia marcescens]
MDDVFGYIINDEILFDIKRKSIIQYKTGSRKQEFLFKSVKLNKTQCRLLFYLLNNINEDIIDKNDIMKNVWDNYNLSSSNQRLWQTINEIRALLSYFDLPDDFISNVHGEGYKLDKVKILALYLY